MLQPFKFSKASDSSDVLNSPPLEGCPQGGVVNKLVINNSIIVLRPVLDLPYNPRLKEKARALRRAGNLPEVLFWMQVSKRKFYKIDFDRQRVIGNYIVDFYVKKLGLVIEIDGASHDHEVVYDAARAAYLTGLGLNVYRIPVNDVMKSLRPPLQRRGIAPGFMELGIINVFKISLIFCLTSTNKLSKTSTSRDAQFPSFGGVVNKCKANKKAPV